MMILRKIKILIITIIVLAGHTFAQDTKPIIGVPFIVNYFGTPYYKYEGAFMDIDIDSVGYVYAASELGVLFYDGEKWETLIKGKFNSVAYDNKHNTLFAGYAGGFGYIAYDSLTGAPYFQKISKNLDYTFKQVYYIQTTPQGVYFFANRRDLFFYDYKTVRKITPENTTIYRGFTINDTLYVFGHGIIATVDHDKLNIISSPAASQILEKKDIRAIFKRHGNNLELISKEGDIFSLNTSTGDIKQINRKTNQQLANYQVYRAIPLSQYGYLLATLSGGLIAIDRQSNILDILNDKFGLGSNAIYDLQEDSKGTLWLATAKGAIEVFTNMPYRYSSAQNGIKGIITDYEFFYKYLIIITQEGFFYTDLTQPFYQRNYFKRIEGSSITYKKNSLIRLRQNNDNVLLISTHRKLQYLDTNLHLHTISDILPSIIFNSNVYPDSVFYLISSDSLYFCSYEIKNNKLKISKHEKYFAPKNFIAGIIDQSDNLYLADLDDSKLFYFDTYKREFYPVPTDTLQITNIKAINNDIYVFTEGKMYKLERDPQTNMPRLTEPQIEFLKNFEGADDMAYDGRHWWIIRDKQMIIYDALNKKETLITYCDNSVKKPYKLIISGDYMSFINEKCFINFSKKKILSIVKHYQDRQANIRLQYIIINDKKIYSFPNKTLVSIGDQVWQLKEEIPSRHKIHIKISNPNDLINIKGYQYKITNYDKDWSQIYPNDEITFMNLPSGRHRIRIRGINNKGIYTNEILIDIKVAPPFYQSIYALAIYFFIILFLIFVLSHRANKAEREKKRLEKIVIRRTKEIMEKNERLEELSEELRQQKEELEAQNEKLKLTNLELRQLSLVAQKTDNSVLILDHNGNIEWWNEGFYKLFKYKFDKFKNTTLREKKIKLRPDLSDALKRIEESKESITYTSHEILDNSQEIWYQTNITPILDDEGEVFRYVVIDIDITDIKLAEKQIEKQKSRLEAQTEILKKGNKLLQEQKKQLQEKTMEILSSLEYAKKIQKALFSEREIRQIFKEYFVLFRAKEIVSGDFFYVTRKENKIILAVADSTGHGVPGAFMSVLGSTLLKDTIEKISELKPNLILQRLRNTIIMALHQENKIGNIKDGMDIGLVIIEPEKSKLYFSGANIPLLIARLDNSGKYEITEIKANRMPIGLHDLMNKPFTLNEMEFKPTDRLYMNTDGYTDQFGGPDNKRYKRSKFRKFIASIQNLSMEEQKQALIDELDMWMGINDQIDDILIVGVSLKEFHKSSSHR